jgi:small GTP-binding protein
MQATVITPPGEGAIGIVRLAGPGATEVLGRVFVGTQRDADEIAPGRLAHGTIQRNGQALDEVIVARLPGGEPVFEVNCHGGAMAVRTVRDALVDAGAIAQKSGTPPQQPPGPALLCEECIRSDALAALPSATTRPGVAMLLHQADGALREALQRIEQLLQTDTIDAAAEELTNLLATASLGRAMLNPPRVALIGPPNAGKSTLLNALLDEERVIVHHEPGTTRDIVPETLSVRGMPFEVMDTAGIRDARDEIERYAVDLATDVAGRCDVALALFDLRTGQPPWMPDPDSVAARVIAVGNKLDTVDTYASPNLPDGVSFVAISAREHENLQALEEALLEPYLGLLDRIEAGRAVVFSAAQEEALRKLLQSLDQNGPTAGLKALVRLTAGRTA